MVAVAVAGVCALTASLCWFLYFFPKLKRFSTSNLALAIEKRVDDYHAELGEWPDGLDNKGVLVQLRGDNDQGKVILKDTDGFLVRRNQLVDEWGHPFVFTRAKGGGIKAVSPGPNGVSGDKDDVDHTEARAFLDKANRPPPGTGNDP